MRHLPQPVTGLVVAAALALAACSKSPDPAASAAQTAAAPAAAKAPQDGADSADGIAWTKASSDADIDAAFATARAESKPVFLYWGAKWCPPCNQVQATLFNRQDFIERSRAFVPVYVDGDSPGAQKLGTRFRVSGYPTMVVLKPSGEEMTRLPGEVDPSRYTELLNLGMNAARPVKAVLADALAGGTALKPNDWRLLAFYSWDTDQTQVLGKDEVAPTLAKLAAACPEGQPETAMRLRLKALAALDAKTPASADLAARPAVLAAVADPARARDVADLLVNFSEPIVRALAASGTPERTESLATFDAALQRLEADATLSRADRMQALIARIDLARIDLPEPVAGKPAPAPRLPEPLLAHVREQAARADREITNGYERQAVITSAAYLLEQAGLGAESDALLKANLARSHSPYYLMSGLAGNAKRARRQRRGAALVSRGLREERRSCDPAAVGGELPGRPGRPRARRRGGDRSHDPAAPARGGEPARRLRAAQRPVPAACRQEAAGLGPGRRPRRFDDAPARRAGHALRRAGPKRGRSSGMQVAADAGGEGDGLSALLSVEHLSVRFGAAPVVDDVSFSIDPARSSRSSANPARASRSPRCRCSAWSTAP